MVSPEVIILDVAHGNCAIVCTQSNTIVIDAPARTTLLDTLRELGIATIDGVYVSHADADHVAGVTTLLLSEEVGVKAVYVNPDASKDTAVWEGFRIAVRVARENKGTKIITGVNVTNDAMSLDDNITIHVAYPPPEIALAGPGGKDMDRNVISTNSNSIVLSVCHEGTPQVLLAADLDNNALTYAIEQGIDLRGKILVFPHHGGLSHSVNSADFVTKILGAVQPEAVIFSNGRSKFDNPRPEVVNAVRKSGVKTIACTQLSKKCSDNTAGLTFNHLDALPSSGRQNNSCCAGTIRIGLDKKDTALLSTLGLHSNFVLKQLKTPLCM